MISSKTLLIASSLFIAAGSLSAHAEGLEFNADAGGAVIHLSESADVATTYYGLRGSLEACDAKATGFYLCGGVSGFTTLEKMNKITPTGTAKSSLNTIGGFVKAKTNLVEGWTFASYAGVAVFNLKHEKLGFTSTEESANVIYTGLELDKQIKGNISMSLKGEIGRTMGAVTNRNVYSFNPGLKVKF